MMDRKLKFAAGAATVFAGYLTGVLTVALGGGGGGEFVSRYLSSETSVDWWGAFLKGPAFLLLTLFCGLFLFGWLFVYPLLFYKSYGYGYTAGLLVAGLGVRGLLPLALCLFPPAAAECVLMVCAARDAFPLSFALFRDPGAFAKGLHAYLLHGLLLFQCSSLVLLWDLFLSPPILSGIREML